MFLLLTYLDEKKILKKWLITSNLDHNITVIYGSIKISVLNLHGGLEKNSIQDSINKKV